jgi:hypothetical protein
MKPAVPPDGSEAFSFFRPGDTVRRQDNDENCMVIWTWRDWLWLDPVDYSDASPFTGRICDYELIRRS